MVTTSEDIELTLPIFNVTPSVPKWLIRFSLRILSHDGRLPAYITSKMRPSWFLLRAAETYWSFWNGGASRSRRSMANHLQALQMLRFIGLAYRSVSNRVDSKRAIVCQGRIDLGRGFATRKKGAYKKRSQGDPKCKQTMPRFSDPRAPFSDPRALFSDPRAR